MTTAEYLVTPETVLPAELAYGVMRVADAPSVHHQRVVAALFRAMDTFVVLRGVGEVLLAPTDVVLDYDAALVVQPDLLFISKERAGIVSDLVQGAPDLVVEVLSPHPRIGRLEERIGWFASYGVRECWLADCRERMFTVLTLGRRGVEQRINVRGGVPAPSSILPGVVLPEFPIS